ncbi:MAG TPA: wax ester/triacylglycerol synthase family O-acyltransferase [Solirubrobacteraceae bacterium]|nr:wax ester/triacylglycerol synthase family O-acyltransferase [Solirubrobacteraceae bacterium]
MARLSPMDASFLRVETETAHMHVGWFSVVELPAGTPALDTAEMAARIAGRLHLSPRFRQRVVPVPLGAGEPVWRDDPGFHLANHVRIVPGVLDDAGLRRATDFFFTWPLRRDRPLWEIVLVPRLASGRAAVLGKIHHAMADGIAAVELGMLLFDLTPDAAVPEPAQWTPGRTEGSARLALGAVADTALEQFRATRKMVELGRSPARTMRVADTLRRAALSLAEDTLRRAPESYLNAEIGPGRTLVTHRFELDRLLRLKERKEVKLGDIVLAACAGALRRFARERGEEPLDLRAMVPVNVRARSGETATGNKITFGFIELPIASPGPDERLERVVAAMGALKADGRIEGSALLLAGLGLCPEPIKDRAARLAASPRLYNLTVSNIPGPRIPVYAAGGRVTSIYPVIPIPDRHALSIGAMTYDGGAHFSCYADPRALPGVERLTAGLEEAITELEGGRPRPRDRSGLRRGEVHRRQVSVVEQFA